MTTQEVDWEVAFLRRQLKSANDNCAEYQENAVRLYEENRRLAMRVEMALTALAQRQAVAVSSAPACHTVAA